MTLERDHDAPEPIADICPHCGEQGFDMQGHFSVGDVEMYRKRCWNCATVFAVQTVADR